MAGEGLPKVSLNNQQNMKTQKILVTLYSEPCDNYYDMFKVISKKALCSKSFTHTLKTSSLKVTTVISKPKTRINFSTSRWSGNEIYLFFVDREKCRGMPNY